MWYCFSIEHAVKVGKHDVISIVQDKHAILADATQDVRKWDAHIQPEHIVAERSGKSQAYMATLLSSPVQPNTL